MPHDLAWNQSQLEGVITVLCRLCERVCLRVTNYRSIWSRDKRYSCKALSWRYSMTWYSQGYTYAISRTPVRASKSDDLFRHQFLLYSLLDEVKLPAYRTVDRYVGFILLLRMSADPLTTVFAAITHHNPLFPFDSVQAFIEMSSLNPFSTDRRQERQTRKERKKAHKAVDKQMKAERIHPVPFRIHVVPNTRNPRAYWSEGRPISVADIVNGGYCLHWVARRDDELVYELLPEGADFVTDADNNGHVVQGLQSLGAHLVQGQRLTLSGRCEGGVRPFRLRTTHASLKYERRSPVQPSIEEPRRSSPASSTRTLVG